MAQVSYGTITITDTNDVESIIIEYNRNQSTTTPPAQTDSGWSTNRPAWAQGYYIWQRTRTHRSGTQASEDTLGNAVCITGSTGQTGAAGRGVTGVETLYATNNSTTTAPTSGWQSQPPTYDSSKPKYWVKVTTTYSSGNSDVVTYLDNGITDAMSTAAAANSTANQANQTANTANQTANSASTKADNAYNIATGINQHFWTIATDYATGLPAGSYITDTAIDTFKSQKTGGNLLTRSDGIWIRNGIKTLASLTGTSLIFYNPSSNAKGMELDSSALKFYDATGSVAQATFGGTQATISGTINVYDGKIGNNANNYWYIGNYTDYNQNTSAIIKSKGTASIQLDETNTWRISTNRIHTSWAPETGTDAFKLHFPKFNDSSSTSKYWDYGLHLPTSYSDKFLYIRNASGSETLDNLLNDLDDSGYNYWNYKFYIDGEGNIHAGDIYSHDTLISGTSAPYLLKSGGTITGNLEVNGTLTKGGKTVAYLTTTPTSGQILVADGTSGSIKTSGYTIATSVPSGALFTDKNVQTSQASTTKIYLAGTPTTGTATGTLNYDSNVYLTTTAGTLHATTFEGNLSGTATKANQDGDGNVIKTTYLKLSGGQVTGPVSFGDSVSMDEATVGNLIVNGAGRFTNGLYGNLTGNADSATIAGGVADVGNGTNTTFAYSKAALTTTSDIAVWNGYELRKISPANLKTSLSLVKGDVGLGNVDNTADANKIVLGVIGEAATSNSARHVWFSNNVNETRRAYDDDFMYNPSTNVLTVGSITGSASSATTATKFSSNRTIQLTGDVTGSASSDGSSGWSIATTVADNSHNHTTDTIVPKLSKSYTGVIASANDDANCYLYCIKIVPETYNGQWEIKYRVYANMDGIADSNGNGKEESIVYVSGMRNTYAAYRTWNNISNTSYRPYYYHNFRFVNEANISYGHICGVSLRNAYNPNNTTYKRNVTFEILESKNCTVSFFDSPLIYNNVPSTGNYSGIVNFDATTQGNTMSGDRNDPNYEQREYWASRTAYKFCGRYQLLVTRSDGQVFPVNTTDNNITTTKTYDTDTEFDPFGQIFYHYTSGTTAANGNIGDNCLFNKFRMDLRYAFNVGGNNVDSLITARKPFYLVATPQANGLAKIHSSGFSQDLPASDDGLIYIYLGTVYEDAKPWRLNLTINHPVYWYKNGAIRFYGGDAATVQGKTPLFTHQDISGKADKSATVSTITYDSTNNKITKTINGTTTDVVTVATIKNAIGSLKNPNAIKINVYGGTSTATTTTYDGSTANQSVDVAGSAAITNVSASAAAGGSTTFTLTKANGATSTFDVTVTASVATGATTITDASGNAVSKGSTTKPVYFSSGVPAEANTYAGGTAVTLNGSGKGSSTASFYAPTTAGTSGQVLTSSGGAPGWTNQNSLSVGSATKATQDSDGSVINTTYLKLSGGKMTGGLEISGHIAGDSGATGHGLWSGGGYHSAYNNIILHGDATTGSSGIAFVSDKGSTNINAPSDRAFIQFHAYGITTATAENTNPTLATSGEANRLVIGVGNDGTDEVWLQTPSTSGLKHQIAGTSYIIPAMNMTTTTANYPIISTTAAGIHGYNTSITMNGGTITATTFSGALSGNATTATKFSSDRTIELTGDVTGSVSGSGENGWSITTTVPDITSDYPYQEVEWVESNGRQFVYLDWKPPINTWGFAIDFISKNAVNTSAGGWNASTNTNGYGTIFGTRNTSGYNNITLSSYNSGYVAIGGSGTTGHQGFKTDKTRQTMSYIGTTFTKPDGTTATIARATENTDKPYANMALFGAHEGLRRSGTGNIIEPSTTRIYSLKFYEGTTVVVDLVGAIRKKDGMTGLYDKINKHFYPAPFMTYGNVVGNLGDKESVYDTVNKKDVQIVVNNITNTRMWRANAPDLDKLEDGQQLNVTFLYNIGNSTQTTELAGWDDTSSNSNVYLKLTLADGTITDWIPCYYSNTGRLTSHYASGDPIFLTYRENILTGATDGTGGYAVMRAFYCKQNYDTNDPNYYNREYYVYRKTVTDLYRYQICVTKSDGRLVPINSVNNNVTKTKTLTTESFDPFGEIYYYDVTTNVAAGGDVGNGYLYRQRVCDLRYSFNCGGYNAAGAGTLTGRNPLFLVTVPQSDGLVKLYSEPLAEALPTSDDGLIYIYLGQVYPDSYPYRLVLTIHHPVYWYKDGAVRQCVQRAETANTANAATKLSNTPNNTTTFLRGDNTWSSTLTNSITVSKAGECGLEVNNTQATNPNQVAFIVGTSGNGGIYSRKHSKWIVYSDASGNVVLNGNANTATTASSANSATKWTSAQTVYVTLGTASTTTTLQGGSSSAQTIGVNGTLGVANGGTGTTSLTSGAALIGNGTGAIQTRSITNQTSGAVTASTNLITANSLVAHVNNKIAAASDTYVTLTTEQTITASQKTFTGAVRWGSASEYGAAHYDSTLEAIVFSFYKA